MTPHPALATGPLPPIPERAALFLDFDGTLIDLAPEPDAVVVDPALPAFLAQLQQHLNGAMAVITGRELADLDRLIAPLQIAGSGMHGLERRERPDAAIDRPGALPAIDELRSRLGGHPITGEGVLVEDKGLTISVHYRRVPHLRGAVETLMQDIIADLPELHLMPGKMLIEAKPRGESKGTAVETFLADPVFAGRTPVFLGDDLSDEDGFRAVGDAGGIGIKIGNGDTRAPYRLDDVAAVRAYLRRYLTA